MQQGRQDHPYGYLIWMIDIFDINKLLPAV